MRQCLFLTTLYTFVSTSIACSGFKPQGTVAAVINEQVIGFSGRLLIQ
jgi:hypothetical protein